jgi:coenzyme F420-reducing hydrogenase delta subunit
LSINVLRQRLRAALEATNAARPIVVFGCDHGADASRLAGDDVHALSLLCAGQLPPSFVEYALRDGAAGVVVAACREGGCEFRFGERWTAERLAGAREPHLRTSVERQRVEFVYAGRGDEAGLDRALAGLRSVITPLPEAVSDASHA